MDKLEETHKALDFDKVLNLLVDFTSTPLGREKVLGMVPLSTPQEIEREYDKQEELKMVIDSLPLSEIEDIRPLLDSDIFSIPQLLSIYKTLKAMRRISSILDEYKKLIPLLFHNFSKIRPFLSIEKEIETKIEPPDDLKDEASEELFNLRREIKKKREEVLSELETLLSKNPEIFSQSTTFIKKGRYVVPLKSERRGSLSGIIIESSTKTIFLEPDFSTLKQNQLFQLKEREEEEKERILKQLSGMVKGEEKEIRESLEAVSELDLLSAKLKFAKEFKCTRPKISTNGFMEIRRGYHPLLMLTKEEVVPLDLSLTERDKIFLISGPNGGGKTVVLKTIGLFSLLLRYGVFLPCEHNTTFPFYEEVYTDIGEGSSLEKGLSSFTASLLRIREILSKASSHSLVLLDELGGSTSPSEGSALGMAVLNELREKGVKTFAASHLEELKFFVHSQEGMRNGAMEYIDKPTFRLIPDRIGESNALKVAENLGFQKRILERAKGYIQKEKLHLSQILSQLTEEERRTKELRERLERKEKDVDELLTKYKEKLANFKRWEKEKKRELIMAQKRFFLQARKDIENLVREIKEKQAEHPSISKAKRFVEENLRKVELPEEPESENDFLPGDWVYSQTFRGEGIIKEKRTRGFLVQFGSIKVLLPGSDLMRVKKSNPSPYPQPLPQSLEFSPLLSLRKLRRDEAEERLLSFLDKASLLGVKKLWVVHGKGEGIIRTMVHSILKKTPKIKRFGFAPPAEGGEGVTVVELE